jgi:hypothetical protein
MATIKTKTMTIWHKAGTVTPTPVTLDTLTLLGDAVVNNFGTDGGVCWQALAQDKDGELYRVTWLPTTEYEIAERFAKAETEGNAQLMAELIEENGGDCFVDVQDQSNACDWSSPYEIRLI